MLDRLLRQRFEMWPSWVRMVNKSKRGRPASECGVVHVLPDEMWHSRVRFRAVTRRNSIPYSCSAAQITRTSEMRTGRDVSRIIR